MGRDSQAGLGTQSSSRVFTDILNFRAAETPHKKAYGFLQNGEELSHELTYLQLSRRAKAIAARLQAAGGKGKRTILLYPPGLEYVAAFYGCLHAGVIAVPAYPPKHNRSDVRLQQIITDCEPAFVLTTEKIREDFKADFSTLGVARHTVCITTDGLSEASAAEWRDEGLDSSDVAFLQYSSGSTAKPRGIIITHGNLLKNSAQLRDAFGYGSDSVCVSWLPLFHDMGLIGGVLQPVYGGFPCMLMPPLAFLESPYRWLKAISRYRATLSGAPNFAYDLCAHAIGEEKRNLDLSSWSVAFNGAEPVRPATLKRFAEAFSPCGFRATSFLPCYGLAEATLIVSGKKQGELPQSIAVAKRELAKNRILKVAPESDHAQTLTGCGTPSTELQVLIIDPRKRVPSPQGVVGEIWVSGPSVAAGYWNRKEETRSTFQAHLADSRKGPYLRTGDLGFLDGAELVITGRLKDLIILNGRNYYPQDIEAVSETSHPLLRHGGVAAFAVESEGKEELVIVQEAQRRHKAEDRPRMMAAIRRAVAETYELLPATVAIVSQGSVLKTSSGKVRRSACREAFLQEKLKILALSKINEERDGGQPEGRTWQDIKADELARHIEQLIQTELARLGGVRPDSVDLDSSLIHSGLDSIRAIQLKRTLEAQSGINFNLSDLFQSISVRALAATLSRRFSAENALQKSSRRSQQIQAQSGMDRFPLSYGQQQLWLLHQLYPENCAYNESYAVHIEGSINHPALRRSLGEIVRRHAILRTVFQNTENGVQQFVQGADGFELPLIDVADEGNGSALERTLQSACRKPFDLATEPGLRAQLLRINDDAQRHVLLLVLHHIVSDGWSMEVLTRELSALYETYSQNAVPALPELPYQYGDYALWQRQWLDGEVLEELLQYWRRQLNGIVPLEPATDDPRPAVFSYRGASELIEIAPSMVARLNGFSQAEGITVFMTLLTSFQVLLARWTRQWDIAVGSPVANRNSEEVERLLGLFMNVLVLRAQLSPQQSFREALRLGRKMTLEGYAHQELPFERLVEELVLARDLARNPLFQVLFAFQNVTQSELKLGDVPLRTEAIENGTSKFDLSVWVEESASGLRVRLEYNTDLFRAENMKRMLRHWQTLLETAISLPEQSIAELPLMREEEQRQVLVEWNQTHLAYDQSKCLHQLIEEQALRIPDAAAVLTSKRYLTYRELNSQSNQLARHLIKLGVRPESCVGICMERTPEMVVGLLGILKAGGAYVPLDPNYPAERLEYMLADAQAPVLVTQESVSARAANYQGRVVFLDRDRELIGREADTAVHAGVTAQNLAYVIYTSGSTGKPKGVCVTHGNVVNFCAAMDPLMGDGAGGNWLSVTSISFDISVFEIFWTLARGFQVKLADPVALFSEHAAVKARERKKLQDRAMAFSLFYFAAESQQQSKPYRLLMEGAKFADSHGFSAVWTPERHFHAFGGIYPNPSVTSAAVAAVTKHIQIRAGSVVLPLQDPLRVAEEWSVVDNLSGGRIGISFASGWQANDFALAPENYKSRKEIMLREIETVHKLWRGQTVARKSGSGAEINIGIYPKPVQPELPFWLTAGGSAETFRIAGEIGANLLTHLLGQSVEELSKNIAVYREARRKSGHPGNGHVTLMIHTFIGHDMDAVREKVRVPFSNYLVQALDLGRNVSKEIVKEEDSAALIEHAFNRYFESSGLMGTLTSCSAMVETLKEIDVDELACLIDFGVDFDSVIESLELLDQLKTISNPGELQTAVLPEFSATHLQCTPSMATMFMRDMEAQQLLAPVQKLFIGGELLPVTTVRELRSLTSAEMFNMYGPTETTIWSAVFRIGAQAGSSIPIGRPIGNTQIYILDEQGNALPAGVPGELYIGGAGITRGYLGRPGLTAERFVPDPFSAVGGSRLYRSGDLARWREDGELEILGRIDQQVKVLGYRIEPGEIEKLLLEVPGVRRCVVVVREDKAGEKRLVAYVVPEEGKEAGAAELRDYLKKHLPDYMVPASYVALAELPHTPNGKIDRKALPRPDFDLEEREYAAPRNAVEEMICGIWAETLNHNRIGIHDNFFELGGQSLLAMQMISRVRNVLGVDLPLRALFETRTVAGLAERIAQIPGMEQVTLRRPSQGIRRIQAQSGLDHFPLSYAQQQLWLLQQLHPENVAYIEGFAVHIEGNVDHSALRQSFAELIRRHAILRTVFRGTENGPQQFVQETSAFEVQFIDLSGSRGSLPDALQKACREPFDLETGPMLRAQLLRLDESRHVLLLVLHHLVNDGWSLGVLTREVSALYDAHVHNAVATLPELPFQYGDFVLWQRQWLTGEVLEELRQYWRGQLNGIVPLELATDYPRPAVFSYRGASESIEIRPALVKRLNEFSQAEGATAFMTLLTSFQVLLAHWTRQWDIAVGSTVANRNSEEVERLVGPFTNELVLRAQLSPQQSFREALRQNRKMTLEGYAHQELPFERLVEELVPERDLARNPLFQVMFVLQNVARPELKLGDVPPRTEALENGTSKFDLTVLMEENASELRIRLEYNTDLFHAESVKRVLRHWETLLEAAIATPEQSLADLPLMREAEQRQVLVEWNNTAVPLPFGEGKYLLDLIEEQVEQKPQDEAVVHGTESLTYRELNRRANQLAHHLKKLGVGPEVRVGICVERSLKMIVGLLGIMKAGGVYVPLDPEYPPERVRYMLEDSQAAVLLSEQKLLAQSPPYSGRIISLDEQWPEIERESGDNLPRVTFGDNLAYLIYTSGSTGRPKGVAIRHSSAAILVAWTRHVYSDEELHGVLASTSICFDVSIFEIFMTLSCGGRMLLVGNALDLAEMTGAEQVKVVTTVPSAMRELARMKAIPDSVRTIGLGGEAVPVALSPELYEASKAERVLNLYGPSEDTTYTTCALLTRTQEPLRVAVGRPVPYTQLYVLDAVMKPVPLGVPGELYIGGSGLARGYWNHPELTAERFVPHPLSQQGGERLYRTGDLVRYRPDSNLEFLTRLDHQVKIRGYRIEPGEIEKLILDLPEIRQCVVAVREDRAGETRLVAYIVPEEGGDVRKNELRAYLQERLPDYMVPAVYVSLAEMPHTPNGKIDRKALPEPNFDTEEREYAAPRNAVEEMICGIWLETLNHRRIGIHDNFFDLGGQSLLAMQVMSRVRNVFGVELPLRTLFENRTVAGLAECVAQVQRAGHTTTRTKPVQAQPEVVYFPLSYGQQQLWLLHQLYPENCAYIDAFAVHIEGSVNHAALRHSLEEIVRRHAILRTVFRNTGNGVQQFVQAADDFEIPLIDIADANALEHALQNAGREPFDLANESGLRVQLLRMEDDEQRHVLLLVMHHIANDGWSLGVLIRELSALYGTYAHNAGPALPELPFQYGDYALWQRQWLTGEVLEELLQYWRTQLNGIVPLEPATDYPRPAVFSYRGAIEFMELESSMVERLSAFSRAEGVTVFMTLLTSFHVLLARWTRQWDISVGSPVANRNSEEVERLVGLFMNVLVLRAQLSPDQSFREALRLGRKMTLEGYAHQELPFERLVEELVPERDLARNPLFQVLFVLQNAARPELKLGNVSPRAGALDNGTSKFDLSVLVEENGSGLRVRSEYNIDLFHAESMKRMLRYWQTLLESAIAVPEQSLSELPLMRENEQRQVLVEWNQTQLTYDRNKCLHQLFEEQTLRTPDQMAVLNTERYLTYRELNSQSNQLARYLMKLGVGPETCVGICMERTPEMVVGLLGILKAGGAYVPLDPNYPVERLEYMLADAQAPVLVTQGSVASQTANYQGKVVFLDRDRELIGRESESGVDAGVTTQNLAYVIYTSGSTGKPKGVCVAHANVVNFCAAMDLYNGGQTGGRLLSVTSISFDMSIYEVFWTLTRGFQVKLADPVMLFSGDTASVLPEFEATHLQCTPSMATMLLNDSKAKRLLAPVQHVVLGGEIIPVATIEELRSLTAAVIFNGYGPTETTVYSAVYRIGEQPDSRIPIGKPVGNTQLYILDEQGKALPPGVLGELTIGGAGIARGYMGRPELTAERFVPDPFSSVEGSRLYRTGDLARWRNDGELEILGRIDQQVKVLGYRIEPGEIEKLLLEVDGVRRCVVVVREDRAGEKRLVAYIVPEEGKEISAKELRVYLKERLPDYMVPAAYVSLAELPHTPSGKTDRKALPKPEFDVDEHEYAGPRNTVEEVICGIWAETLNHKRVGIHDNFFELGGQSLLAMQVISRLRNVFGVELPLRALFETRTVAGLAERIAQMAGMEQAATPLLVRAPRDGYLPLSFAQQRLWFLDQLEPGNAAYNMPFGFRAVGQLDEEVLRRSVREIVQRHEVLRTSFPSVDGKPVQHIKTDFEPEIEVMDLGSTPEPEREEYIRQIYKEERLMEFDLGSGPLMRVKLLRLTERDHVLLVIRHHIIGDGWSNGIMMREFSQLYTAYVQEQEGALPELRIQYADFAVWQRQWLQGEVLQRQLEYWRQQLLEIDPLELPVDYPRKASENYAAATLEWKLSEELSAALRDLGKQQGFTLFTLLAAGFQLLLARYSGQRDIAVGTPIAGRRWAEIEGVMGFFVNTLVLRANASGRQRVREFLNHVHQITLDAYQHQDVPFEKLVEELHPDRDLSRTPLFQAMLVFENVLPAELELPGLKIFELKTDVDVAKFDLLLKVDDSGPGIRGGLVYRTELFMPSTVTRLLRHFERLLAGIAGHMDMPVSELPLLSDAEREEMLTEWNRTEARYSLDQCVHELIEEQARRIPNAVAVVYEGQQLTYAELNGRANQLAHHLRQANIGPDVRVALCVKRSLETVTGLLAILKAGGAYVPLDPNLPAGRMEFMLQDSQATVLLAEQAIGDRIKNSHVRLIALDSVFADVEANCRENLTPRAAPENLAYLIYTSGSTGRPKAVGIEHRQVLNYVRAIQERADFCANSSFVLVSSLAADLGNTMFFPALCGGGTLHLVSEERALNPEMLGDYMKRFRIDYMKITPSHLQALLNGNRCLDVLPKRELILGGEASSWDWIKEFQSNASDLQVMNHYGPTECTVGAITFHCEAGEARPASGKLPLGRPLSNARVYVLDKDMHPAPVGVAGELYIGGDGVGRGYLNQPGLTAARFVPDVFSKKPDARLYRTGDRVKWLANGILEFLGRIDEQVKIRGYRVELGEIEAVLRQSPEVRQGSVILQSTDAQEENKKLIAYVVGERQPVSPDDIESFTNSVRQHMEEKLPEYMIPVSFVWMENLPLLRNGKLDRRALPLPQARDEYAPPSTAIEQTLCGIWLDLLRVERIGIHDNFFSLGGHSLLATQVMSRVRQTFKIELPLRAIFESPTIERLAREVHKAQQDATVHPVPESAKFSIVLPTDFELEKELDELESLSDEEIDRLLEEERQKVQ